MHVTNKLRSVRLSQFSKDDSDMQKALTKLIAHISTKQKQTPRSFRTECNKLQYLQMAVQGYPWATPCIAGINENTLFQDFYIECSRRVQAKMAEMELKDLNRDNDEANILRNESKPSIHFTQSQYGRNISTQLSPEANTNPLASNLRVLKMQT